jgi:hypothetical protein
MKLFSASYPHKWWSYGLLNAAVEEIAVRVMMF